MATLEAVLFDAGDTLISMWGGKLDRFGFLCEQAGIPVPSRAAAQAGARAVELFFQQRYQSSEYGTPGFWLAMNQAGLAAMGAGGDLDDLAERITRAARSLPREWVVDPDAPPLLAELRRAGYKLGIVSNWDPYLTDVLAGVGLLEAFDFVGASDAVGIAKPDPAFFDLVLAELGVAPPAALHVGDSPSADVGGALAAGVRPLLLDALDLYGAGFPGLPSFARVRRLAEVRDHLDG